MIKKYEGFKKMLVRNMDGQDETMVKTKLL